MINDHRATGCDCFLHRRAPGFSDKQMAGPKHARKLFGPTDDLDLAMTYRLFDCRTEFAGMADGDGQMNIEIDKSSHEFGCLHGRRVHDIEDSPIVI